MRRRFCLSVLFAVMLRWLPIAAAADGAKPAPKSAHQSVIVIPHGCRDIVAFVAANVGREVPGACYGLGYAATNFAGYKVQHSFPTNQWGKVVYAQHKTGNMVERYGFIEKVLPGDIIEYYRFDEKLKEWDHVHLAIVFYVDPRTPNVVKIAQQNSGGRMYVTIDDMHLDREERIAIFRVCDISKSYKRPDIVPRVPKDFR